MSNDRRVCWLFLPAVVKRDVAPAPGGLQSSGEQQDRP
jgi:hypothetical protein